MAYMGQCICSNCGKSFNGVANSGEMLPVICGECIKKRKEKEKTEYFNNIMNKTLEERVRQIEEWIYEHDRMPDMRIPPRF